MIKLKLSLSSFSSSGASHYIEAADTNQLLEDNAIQTAITLYPNFYRFSTNTYLKDGVSMQRLMVEFDNGQFGKIVGTITGGKLDLPEWNLIPRSGMI